MEAAHWRERASQQSEAPDTPTRTVKTSGNGDGRWQLRRKWVRQCSGNGHLVSDQVYQALHESTVFEGLDDAVKVGRR